jgi:hypothetical protein
MGYRAHVDERMTDLPGQRATLPGERATLPGRHATGDAGQSGPTGQAGPIGDAGQAGRLALVVVLSVIVVLFACGGTGLALYLINGHHGGAAVAGSAPNGSGSGRTGGSPASTASPLNPAAVVTGECVANDGTEDIPKLRLTACAPGAFLVVGRFDGTDDVHKCDGLAGATHNFFYRTDPASLSFVLCLKRQ